MQRSLVRRCVRSLRTRFKRTSAARGDKRHIVYPGKPNPADFSRAFVWMIVTPFSISWTDDDCARCEQTLSSVREDPPTLHDEPDVTNPADVSRRVSGNRHDIRQESISYLTDPVGPPDDSRVR